MKRRHKRLSFVVIGLALLGAAAALILTAIEESVVFFYSPTDILAKEIDTERRMRVGGLVEEGSVERGQDSTVRFRVTDLMSAVPVQYRGLLPDLFAENQGASPRATSETEPSRPTRSSPSTTRTTCRRRSRKRSRRRANGRRSRTRSRNRAL